jgi:hypothetical protein
MTLNILSYCFAATWFFDGVHVVHPLRFFSCPIMCLLYSELCVVMSYYVSFIFWAMCCYVLLCVFTFWVLCCDVLLCVFTFWVLCCDVRFDFRITTMFGSSLSLVVCRRVHVFFTLFVHVGIQHILCCVFVLFFYFVYPMLPVSLDCPFLIIKR